MAAARKGAARVGVVCVAAGSGVVFCKGERDKLCVGGTLACVFHDARDGKISGADVRSDTHRDAGQLVGDVGLAGIVQAVVGNRRHVQQALCCCAANRVGADGGVVVLQGQLHAEPEIGGLLGVVGVAGEAPPVGEATHRHT